MSEEDKYASFFENEMLSKSQEGAPQQEESTGQIRRGAPPPGGGSFNDGDEGEMMDMGSATRDMMKRRARPNPQAQGGRGPPSVPSMPMGMPPPQQPQSQGPATKGDNIMDSVRKAAASGGKDSDLEVAFFQNMLEETNCS